MLGFQRKRKIYFSIRIHWLDIKNILDSANVDYEAGMREGYYYIIIGKQRR